MCNNLEESALPYLLIEPGNRNTTSEISTVILLHGSEGNNETLLPFTSFLNDFRLLLPQAPLKVKGGLTGLIMTLQKINYMLIKRV